MKKALFTLLIIVSGLSLHVQAQSLTRQIGKVSGAYNFWLYEPAKVDTLKPLVIFLHGNSLCGRDLNMVRKYGTIDAIEKGRNLDAYVIAPQNPGGAWKPEKVKLVMDWVINNKKIDTNRIYVLGMSLGGYGTIDFAATYPNLVAAGIAMCGGGTRKSYCGLNQVPLWIAHGTADRAVGETLAQRVAAHGYEIPAEQIIPVGAVIGSHIGPGGCGLIYIAE
jgi:predicted peptidase